MFILNDKLLNLSKNNYKLSHKTNEKLNIVQII